MALENVSKSFGKKKILNIPYLFFPENQTSVLIGPSGAGKSSLLKILINLVEPDTGSVYFQNEKVTPKNIAKMRHRIGYVIQEGGLFPHLTVKKNLCLLPKVLKMPTAEMEERIIKLAELVNFPLSHLSHYPKELSFGQVQKVGLMRALMMDPSFLLLDEPFGSQDPLIRQELLVDLKEIFLKLRKTVILVTHHMKEAKFLGDFIILMRGGEIVQKGSYEELTSNPLEPFVSQFLNTL